MGVVDTVWSVSLHWPPKISGPPRKIPAKRMRRPAVGMLALALVAACTVPTEMPNWDVQWNLPVNVDNLGIDIAKLPLPSGISIDSTGPGARTGFAVAVSSLPAITRTLGAQCPTCPNATAPKPAFTAPPATTTVALTAGTTLQTATLATGSQIVVQLNNGFGFDPLNPPGGPAGTITLAVTNGTATLGTLALSGGTTTIPAGGNRTFTVPLSGTINTASLINVVMTMDSPAGSAAQPVTMSSGQLFTATPSATIKVATAVVTLAANPIVPSITQLDDLAELGDMANRIENVATPQGAMILTVTNPLSIGANAVLTFSGFKTDDATGTQTPIVPVTKNLALPVGGGAATTSTVTVSFTGQELRRMLGASIVATFSGNTIAGTTPVTPTSKITTTARMRMRLFVKEIE